MLVLLALWLAPSYASLPSGADPNQLKKYVSENPPFTVFRPATWKVRHEDRADSFRIVVSGADAASIVEIYFAANRGSDSLGALASKIRELRPNHPDLSVSEVLACKDASCAAATLSYTDGRIRVSGRSYVQSDAQQVVIRSYSAPVSRLATQRNLMLTILANIRLGSPDATASSTPATLPPLRVDLTPRRTADGSISIQLPPDWILIGQKGRTLAAAPENAPPAGFLFTVFQVLPPNIRVPMTAPDVILSPYAPPAQIILPIFQKFGNRDVRIVELNPIPEANAACLQQEGRGCEAATMTVNWISPKGAACTGGLFVLNSLPSFTGVWSSMVGGLWAPAQDVQRYLPMLEQIAKSFAINDQYAANYIQQGIVNLRNQFQRTQEAMRSLNEARADNQRAWEARQARKDASNARWDDYRRGNSYWISDLEGGKVYATDPWGTRDTRTGDRVEGPPYNYIHFEGQNPRHRSENMREVSSYELQKLTGGR